MNDSLESDARLLEPASLPPPPTLLQNSLIHSCYSLKNWSFLHCLPPQHNIIGASGSMSINSINLDDSSRSLLLPRICFEKTYVYFSLLGLSLDKADFASSYSQSLSSIIQSFQICGTACYTFHTSLLLIDTSSIGISG